MDENGNEWLEALSDHLILEDLAASQDQTPSGLLIPASAAKSENGYRRFRVIASGPLCNDDRVSEIPDPSINPGDIVLAPVEGLGTYREAGELYYIASYEQIAAVIR